MMESDLCCVEKKLYGMEGRSQGQKPAGCGDHLSEKQ